LKNLLTAGGAIMPIRGLLSLILSLLLVAALSVTSRAQAIYGTVFGTVTDPQGARVVGAVVTATDLTKNVTTTAQTNESGNYTVTHLIPGRYSVKVERQGYKIIIREVEVRADVAARIDFAFEIATVAEQVTVTADTQRQSLKTDRADVAINLNRQQIEDLPIFDRNFTKFELLSPGTQQLFWQHAPSENPQGSIQIVVNGQHFSGTSFHLDGADNRDPILGIIVINPTLESVSEAKITTQNYDAEFGMAIGGVVAIQTKSGTNEPHGSAFLFRRNDVTSARNPFSQSIRNPLTGEFIPDTLWNQFGGSLGGPISKNKTFIFGDYQGTRRKTGGSVLTTVPTALARNGDFSEYPSQIFDPQTGDPLTGMGRTPFAGNHIPQDRLSPQVLNLLKLIPLPNRPGTDFNFTASGIEAFDSDQFNVRDDHYWSENLHLFGRYSYARFNRSSASAFGEFAGGPAFDEIGFAGKSDALNQSIAAGFDYTLTRRTVTDFRFGFFRYRVKVLPGGFGTHPATDAGIPGLNVDDFFTSGMPSFIISGVAGSFRFGNSSINCNCPLNQDERQYQLVNNWSLIRGDHTWKVGGDIRFAENLRVSSDQPRAGALVFFAPRTGRVDPDFTVSSGLGLASFLLGDVSMFSRFASTTTDAREYQRRWFFYGQDTWRATRNLTLNYGLRWELIFPEYVKRPGDGSLLNLETGELFVGGVGEVNKHFNVKPSYKAFAPRLGIAYEVTDKTVIRAGYGRSFDIGTFGSVFGHTVTQNLPVLSTQFINTESFQSVFNLREGPPPPGFRAVPANGRLPLPTGVLAGARPFKMRLPTLDAWNVTVQHRLARNTFVEAAYVGNKGTHVFPGFGVNYNANQPVSLLGAPDAVRRPFFSRFGWAQDVIYYGNDADNRYNALQTKLETRFSGLNILSHYTLSSARDNDADYFIHDRSLGRGPAGQDPKHVFVFSEVWELPLGRGKRFLRNSPRIVDLLFGDWQLNTITTWMTGLPFTPVSFANCSVNAGPCRPDRVGDPGLNHRSRDGWFAVGIGPGTPWARAAVGKHGNAGRNSLRGPSFSQTDLSVFKKFKITEAANLEFRVEGFNIFNQVNLGLPDACVDCNPGTAGKVFSLPGGAQMRQFQFGMRLSF
jgi:outer membrane receptor protein involved in Fe transport